ncbi:D-amino acid dehydrogenase [Psychrobacter sp. F1192]|uniref:D-amino acid dehydrogenase n=1 Tax=Psychrobacter coccoides TaxID=2818440 RepID=A0ABS3NM46_9GAMM|nr:D-amino acid dehydrogenase [Psychrobacter coccoides]MBO1530471.1 D-amino acid dehydrogenase [Psychrobacter coccoides]
MTHIAVLGAGVVGVTSAWYLRQAGYDVTVIEREPAAGMQTSFANGGQISVSHATPWANPATPKKALKWLFKEDAPLLYRLRADKAQLRWALQFLQECRTDRADANLVQMVRLGLYSRDALQQLRADIGIDYQQQTRGIMHLYTDQAEFDAAIVPTQRMQALGCERHIIDIDNAVSLEPALYPVAHKLKGATYTSQDESGNAHLFTQRLAERCADAGVQFLYDTEVLALNADAHSTHPHIHSMTIRPAGENAQTFSADSYVLALGSYSAALTKPLAVHLPIFPAKGYSATYQVNPRAPHLAPFVSLIDDEFKLVTSRLGDKLRVAGTAEFNGYNLDLNSVRCEAITRRVQQLFPKGIIANSVEYWTGLRPMTPSNVPLIGRAHQGHVRHGSTNIDASFDNLWLNTGHGTLGWTHACGSAKALSLLVQGDRPAVDFDFTGVV